ncbi:MAG: hypothetical protein ABR583_10720 [Gaiellaceae bacterium]
MRRAAFAAVLSVALLACAGAATGAVERIRVADSGRPETQTFPPDVYVTLESPPGYAVQGPGVWAGPPYWPASRPDQVAGATLEWSVVFRDRALDVARTAASSTAHGWPDDQRNGLSVPLLVGGREVGTLPGFFVLTAAPGVERAQYEAVAAVPLGEGAQAVVRFELPRPAADSSAWGDYLVMGTFLASTWNRGQALIALSRIRVEGNLAPRVLSIRPVRGARAVRGKAVDPFVNPLVGVLVTAERWTGSSWRRVRSSRTTRSGTYRIPVPRPGRYRTAVTNAGITVPSVALTVR